MHYFFFPYQQQPPSPTSPKDEEGDKLPEQHLPQATEAVSTNSQSEGYHTSCAPSILPPIIPIRSSGVLGIGQGK